MRIPIFAFFMMLILGCKKDGALPGNAIFQATINGTQWKASNVSVTLEPANTTSAVFRITATAADGTAIYLRSNNSQPSSIQFRTNPATLVSFSGTFNKTVSNFATLNWSTANQANLARIIIERGNDGHSFIEVGTMNATGGGSTLVNYSFQDKPGVNNLFTNNLYYRLKLIDTDSSWAYSHIILMNINTAAIYQYAAGNNDHAFGKTGSVSITAVDYNRKRISGTFSFSYKDDRTGTEHSVTNGMFENIPYQ